MPGYKTRDQLGRGILAGEPFHMIVNHWPSRYGGSKSSPLREFAAGITRHIADSLHADNPQAKVIIVGDMNVTSPITRVEPSAGSCEERRRVKPGGYSNVYLEAL